MDADSNSKLILGRTLPERVRLIAFSLVIWTIAGWMFWVVESFVEDRTWWDFAVKLVLHDLIFTIIVFGCALVAHALFPSVTQPFVEKAAAKLSFLLSAIILFVLATIVFLSLVVPVLLHFGLVK